MSDVTPDTPVRKLRFSALRALADLLDPQDTWRSVMADISKPCGEPRYTQMHIRRFEACVLQGKSPTMEMLFDWGTSDCTVGDLVQILIRHQLFAAVTVLLPNHSVCHTHTGCDEVAPSSPVCLQGCEITKPVEDNSNNPPKITKTVEEDSNKPQKISKAVEDDSNKPVQEEADSSSGAQENTWGSSQDFHTFSLHELTMMTQHWDERPLADGGCRLGSGGFGVVFRGRMGDKHVAVKKLNPLDGSSYEDLKKQFYQEIQTLRSVSHENVLRVLGCSRSGPPLCVVFELMVNGSLLERLACAAEHTPAEHTPALTWRNRCWITVGAARGLSYLHTHTHIHRDIKSANILLDEGFVAKISDFGLTRSAAAGSLVTLQTERIVGTTAYMAPEALRGEITAKSDVFSFGVVLLEVLSGLPPVDESRDPALLLEMKDDLDDEDLSLLDFTDRRMQDWRTEELQIMYEAASQCLCQKKNKRPAIAQVLSVLEDLHQKVISR
ncbi:interleukin-1 receptor-associated kinase 4 [Danio aesculapii]|uniref:interleukin-1 receptor-associated kinase 4 n=1 Tax=Danio aesculapii TaxID=1142201 RepID=UPI0024C05BBC|nr:interleukin-1 receptor-associated kinase 4 [Danio aesculapii]XP_056307223.1 interleukin-1 receptor-associated kinase 4 [Danio aesculapii]